MLLAVLILASAEAAALGFSSPRSKAVTNHPRPAPAIAAAVGLAAILFASAPNALAAEQPSAPAQPPAAESSRAYFDPKGGGQGISAVVATPSELKELKSGAATLELPKVSAESDLGRLLSGAAGGPGTSADPRAHN